MRKIIPLVLCAVLCLLMLAGCNVLAEIPEVFISVGAVEPGMAADEIPVFVTLDHQPVECTVEWIIFETNGYRSMEPGETIPANFCGRLDVSYFLPKGFEPGDLPTTVDAPGGTYDGTGEGATAPDGRLEAWSHILYEFTAQVPDVEISVGTLEPGIPFSDVPIQVTLDGIVTPHTVEWIFFSDSGYGSLEPTDTVPEHFMGRADVSYYLPLGVDPGDISVTVDAPEGAYDGTGEGATAPDGRLEAWSHIIYEYTPTVPDVTVSLGEFDAGTAIETIPFLVTFDGAAAECGIQWICYEEDGYRYLSQDDTIPEAFNGRVDINYFLPLGVAPADITVTVDAPGGTYDGTSEGTSDPDGRIEALTHISYTAQLSDDGNGESHTHKWSINLSLSKKPTCKEDGWDYIECAGCDKFYKESLASTGHNYGQPTITQAPACTREGVSTTTCVNCGDAYQNDLPALGHDYSKSEITRPSDCLISGVRTFTCSRCGNSYQESLPKTDHNLSAPSVIPPTCTKEGTTTQTCKTCGAGFISNTPALGHDYSKSEVTRPSDCLISGVRTFTCSRCGDSYQESLPKTDHDLSEPRVTPPTCTKEGTTTRTCKTCGAGFIINTPALGHSWSAFSYLNGRLHERTCSTCGATETGDHSFNPGSVRCTGCGADIVN